MATKTFICNLYDGTDYSDSFAVLTITPEFARQICEKYAQASYILAQGVFTQIGFKVRENGCFQFTQDVSPDNFPDWDSIYNSGDSVEAEPNKDWDLTDCVFTVTFYSGYGADYIVFSMDGMDTPQFFETGSFSIRQMIEIADYPTDDLYVLTEELPNNYKGQLLWKDSELHLLTDGTDTWSYRGNHYGSRNAFYGARSQKQFTAL